MFFPQYTRFPEDHAPEEGVGTEETISLRELFPLEVEEILVREEGADAIFPPDGIPRPERLKVSKDLKEALRIFAKEINHGLQEWQHNIPRGNALLTARLAPLLVDRIDSLYRTLGRSETPSLGSLGLDTLCIYNWLNPDLLDAMLAAE